MTWLIFYNCLCETCLPSKFILNYSCFSAVITKDIPFSLNYSDMIDKCEKGDVRQTKSITSTQAEEQLENIKKTAGVDTLERLGT